MSLLPENATFEERLHDYFAALRGGGLMLSGLDAELASAWSDAGVPFEVVARGLQHAVEKKLWDARPGEPVVRSLRACKREVEAEIDRHRARTAGAQTEGAPKKGLSRARRELRQLAIERPEVAARIEPLIERAEREGMTPLDDERICLWALRALPAAERATIWREIRAHVRAAPVLSFRARKMSRRFHTCAVTRKALSLPAFW